MHQQIEQFSKYRPDIDGLRAVAVLAVVIFHAEPSWLPGGFVGVDIFFVISGFLISSIILESIKLNRFSFREFYARRIRRIFPALILVLLSSWFTGWWVLTTDEFLSLGRQIVAGMAFLSNFHFWLTTDYFGAAADIQPSLHLWSLGVEEQFYVLWPPLLIAACRCKLSLALVTCVLILVSFSLNIWATDAYRIQAFYLPYGRMWELWLGSLLAIGSHVRPSRFSANVCACFGLALILAALICIDVTDQFPGWLALLPTVGAALIIFAGKDAIINHYFVGNRWAAYIGLISYPIYLWHWPLLAFARIAIGGDLSLQLKVSIVAASIGLGWVTYLLLERPLRFGSLQGPAVGILVAGGILIACLGAATVASGGLPGRFPAVVQDLADYRYPQYEDQYRVSTCFLRPDQGPGDFANACAKDLDLSRGILLWGDSHAAHLYSGLMKIAEPNGIPVAQLNSASCPPVLGFNSSGRPNCPALTEFGISEIARTKPAVVIISADWPKYAMNPAYSRLEETINRARTIGAGRVLLIGPVPNWRPSLPKILLDAYLSDPSHKVPYRLNSGLNDDIRKVDNDLRKRAEMLHIEYFSAFDAFCNLEGCLTRLGDGHDDLIAWDYGHLTLAGSIYLMNAILDGSSLHRWIDALKVS
ncbi:acyltransferase 3 family protein [Rhizobium phaseoli]|uniref:acyltransferase family protein n=1 Tax=Rhizobium phaseoli TaxID=396 RepID=UPI0007EAF0E5|nr:acyltransferase family protein [Rhizobium phaseoli]ANL26681.1 acyltransferase 3 family protein [Rhizobium phaseoli]